MPQKHTPGPMRVDPARLDKTLLRGRKDYPRLIVGRPGRRCVVGEARGSNAQADAERLAACWNACKDILHPEAVPELVAALEHIRDHLPCHTPGGINDSLRKRAEAALAKVQRAPGRGEETDKKGCG